MFKENIGAQSYIKYMIAAHLGSLKPAAIEGLSAEHQAEIESLSRIRPHAIITTNYDEMLEMIFPDHQRIIGQQILKGQHFSIGELFKIHGCVSDHESIVFTEADYNDFMKRKKFLSAKLLTFFNDHPLLFIGYSAGDPNIRAILSDIDQALPEKGGVIPNVFILQWNPDLTDESWPARDRIIPTEEDRNVRVKLIEASDFGWVFDAFAANPALNQVNTRVLRSLVARSYELVRHDIPKMTVEADFKMLSSAVESSETFAKLFGIANINDYSAASAQFPYSPTEVGQALGGASWHLTNQLIDKILEQKKVSIKANDNRYHRKERVNKTPFHKYSHDAVELLKKVRDGHEYELDLGIPEKKT
ncbi:SIR2 family NAD-dependent protein deacylase [Mesorhizobium sp. 43Arga]